MNMTRVDQKSQHTDPEQWVDLYADALFSYTLIRLEDKNLAEELVQETFLAALGAISSFEGRASVKTWLFSILKNKMTDHLRRKYKEASSSLEDYSEHYLDEFFTEQGEWLAYPERWQELPQRQFEQREFFQILLACLAQLSQRQRDAFTLRELDGVASEEICKVLGISATNYWVVMHRARLLLRRCLEHDWSSVSS